MDPMSVQYEEKPPEPRPLPEGLNALEALRHIIALCAAGAAVVVRQTENPELPLEFRSYKAPEWGREVMGAALAQGTLSTHGRPVSSVIPGPLELPPKRDEELGQDCLTGRITQTPCEERDTDEATSIPEAAGPGAGRVADPPNDDVLRDDPAPGAGE